MQQGRFFQAGFVVPDLDRAMAQWHEATDVGPFFVLPDVRPDRWTHHGAPAELVMRMALAQSGDMQIELIEQLSEAPSVYTDIHPKGSAGGFHHLLTMTRDLDEDVAAYAKRGVQPGCLGGNGPLKFAYFDTRRWTGYYTEVMEEEEGILDLFRQVREAAQDWDGSDPVRIIGY